MAEAQNSIHAPYQLGLRQRPKQPEQQLVSDGSLQWPEQGPGPHATQELHHG